MHPLPVPGVSLEEIDVSENCGPLRLFLGMGVRSLELRNLTLGWSTYWAIEERIILDPWIRRRSGCIVEHEDSRHESDLCESG